MIKIRLARAGARNAPFYHIVAIDEQRKRSGKALEVLGYWHPATKVKKVDKKGIEAWVEKGAVVTDAVKKLM